MKEGLKLHNLPTDHVTIRSELRYFIGAKIVDLICRVFGENPLQRSGSGLELDPELNREFGPVANTTQTPLELRKVLSQSAKEFSGVSESTCSYGGVFRMLQDLT